MSMRYKGGVISATAPITSASVAPGIWTLEQQFQAIAGSGWPGPSLGWIATLGAVGINEAARSVAVDSAGNVYVNGINNISGSGIIETAKYSSVGVIQWQRRINSSTGANEGGGEGVVVDSSGNAYVLGTSYTAGSAFVLSQYNSSGTVQWSRRFGDATLGQQAFNIAIDSSNNIYICGESATVSTQDIQVAKYNSSGVIQWQNKYASASNDEEARSITTDSSGNVYFCGYGPGTSPVVKCNSSGVIQWQRVLSLASTNIEANGITVDSSGNVYVAGRIDTYTQSTFLVKYNSSGSIQWQKKLGFSRTEFFSVTVDSSGNIYATGYIVPGSNTDLLIAKYNSSGALQWQRSLATDTSNNDAGYSITTDNLGSIYVAGYFASGSNENFIFAKLPTDGSGTGTYSVGGVSCVYSATSEFEFSSSLTDAAGSLTVSATTLPDAAWSYTDVASTLTSNTTTI